MKNPEKNASCCSRLDRRQFLTRLSLAGGATLMGLYGCTFDESIRTVIDLPVMPGDGDVKPRIRVGFMRTVEKNWMGWPGAAYDPVESQELYTNILGEANLDLKVILDVNVEPLSSNESIDRFLKTAQSDKADGTLVVLQDIYALSDRWNPLLNYFLQQRGKLPMVLFSPRGTSMTHLHSLYRNTPNFFMATTQHNEWLGHGLRMQKALWQMKNTRLAVISNTEERIEKLEPVGTTLHHMPFDQYLEAYRATANSEDVKAIARSYISNARDVVEPTNDEVVEGARCYLASRQLLKETGCHSLTMRCLDLIEHRTSPPPCIAYMQLLNERTCGGCEGDVTAALSLMLTSYLFNKPGFMHNPTSFNVQNTYGGSHCVAPTKMDGFDKQEENYLLRSHHESDWGTAPQVLFRENQPGTVFKFLAPNRIHVATGTILRNLDTRPGDGKGGCRTSFEMQMDDVTDVLDIRGHHNVLIYGKHLHDIRAWGQLAGVHIEHITGRVLYSPEGA
jgi:hypothetical protein